MITLKSVGILIGILWKNKLWKIYLKNDDFAQFIINEHLADSDMTDEQKLELVGSSIEEFSMALDCFKLKAGAISKH